VSTTRPARPPGRTWLIVAVCGCLLAIGLPLLWWIAHPSPTRATVAFTSGAPAPPSRPIPSATQPGPDSSAPPPAQSAPIPVTAATFPASAQVPAPIRLQAPAIGVDATVQAEGLDSHGDMALPVLVGQVGWYRYGPAPGTTSGAVVIAGHVDAADQGEGALFRLRDIPPGSRVTVTTADGTVWTYRVVSRQAFDKRTIPLPSIFSRTGSPHLTIITCGGSFNRAALSYVDNIVVTAVPV
jgi:hypothetical protein